MHWSFLLDSMIDQLSKNRQIVVYVGVFILKHWMGADWHFYFLWQLYGRDSGIFQINASERGPGLEFLFFMAIL